MKIYEKAGYITVTYYERPKHILYDWTRFAVTLDELKTLHMKGYEVIKEKGVSTLIAETSKVKDVLFQECIDWFGNEFIPLLQETSVKRIITVVPQTALGRWSTKGWQSNVGVIELYNVDSLERARELVV